MISTTRPWTLVLLGGLFVVVTCGLSLGLMLREQERLHDPIALQDLATQARMLAALAREDWPELDSGDVQGVFHTMRAERTQLVLATLDGTALLATPAGPGSDLDLLPEVREALAHGSATGVRAWGPQRRLHVVAAARVGPTETPVGFVWLARPARSLTADPGVVARVLGVAAGLAALTTGIVTLLVARWRQRLVRRVLDTARRLSSGELESVPEVPGQDELAVLSANLSAVRSRLVAQVELIERQRSMLASLVNQLQEGVIVARADGRIALLNPAALQLLHLSLGSGEAFVGRTVESCIPQHALQRLLVCAGGNSAAPARLAPAPGSAHVDARLEVQSPAGTVHLLARASDLMLADPDGGPASTGRVVVLLDITELQRTVQMRTDFVANASHELRTPLSTIRAAVETLQTMDLVKEGPAARQFLAKIDRQSGRLEQLVKDLLDLSRIESPTERFMPEPIEVRRLLADLQGRFGDALERQQLNWDTRVEPPDLVHVRVNPHLVRLVLDNLVDNAIKFTAPGGHVMVRVRHEGSAAVFEVHDDGCGIAPEDQPRVFERFFQVERARSGSARGTGLGLSIVRHAVSAMHGSVRLESELGRGTRIFVTVPEPPAEPGPRASTVAPP
jgi:two-component system phosphate regulon sensor histidine kinase PhoR